MVDPRFDIIVIGGGHAGAEAAWAAAGLGADVALVTMDPSRVGAMSCNPAIGGLAKGQIVREIDALGGLMGRAIDATGIQFRTLNTSKGAAVQAPRAQADKYAYAAEVQRLLASRGIAVIAGTVDELLIERGCCCGAVVNGARLAAGAVVLTTGTFMRSLMHTGEQKAEGGRVGEGSAVGISFALRQLGFELGRLKTGTPPRLAAESIDFTGLEPQPGDEQIRPFSEMTPHSMPGERFPVLRQVCCHTTSTNAAIHDLIRANIHRAPMYSGQIEAECGPRYCPSIEDKVVRFADRASHHVFLEPESLNTNEIYCNGISTSLPRDVQDAIVPLMPGCERATILKYGYAVEYDMVWPHQIDATCMTKRIEGLFLAGQINGTSGYEEAAGQGVVAGLNAVRYARRQEPIRFGRDRSYIGVMMDDLVTKTPREPYRMFTSRAEFRLILRGDTAPDRLTPMAREWGLICERRWELHQSRAAQLGRIGALMHEVRVDGRSLHQHLRSRSLAEESVADHLPRDLERRLIDVVISDIQYEGYVEKQHAEIRRLAEMDQRSIPAMFEYARVPGLGNEAIDVLSRFKPATLGQAGRLAGVNPADVTLLEIAIRGRHSGAGTTNGRRQALTGPVKPSTGPT
ncbi:MAG: tRNA uridine-5-carboxymethylaminomethyl(34) synthesis enzyme MnmG [Phycisphaerales bacterium]|nr:tRNA uridine-5-carboxymethylaminomethyl(34) synthesis enzyme MnmG [Phycisphaerales bacterium]